MYKRGSFIGIIYIFALFFTTLSVSPAHAATFNTVSVRFDRMKISSLASGLVCAIPSTTSTEDSVKVTFPAGFSVHGLSLWTVSTANIPAGSTPWTGISNATDVTGQTVTFPSGDLTPNTQYCFSWNNASALTTGSSQSNYTGTVATYSASSSLIDSSVFAVTLVPSDSVTVTASILPNATQIDTVFTSNPPLSTVFHEDDTITITYKYRSSYSTPTPVTITTSWAQGTIQNTSNMVDVVSYVVGSATDADDNTVPIVDLQNKSITWSIPSLASSGTYHEVSYTLQVRSTFPTASQISMNASATLTAFNMVLAQDTLPFSFLQSITPTPTPSQAPASATHTPTPITGTGISVTPASVSITPTEVPSNSYIKKVNLVEITSSSSTVLIESNNPVKIHVAYGTDQAKLSTHLDITEYHLLHKISLSNLQSDTTYYMTLTAIDKNGNTITSDIMTFKTTISTATFTLKPEQITLSTDQSPLSSPNTLILVIPFNKPLKITINTPPSHAVSYMTARFEHKDVLGITSAKRNTPVEETRFIEVLPGTYAAEILSPPSIGTYELVLTVHDIYGSYFLVPLPHTIMISHPMQVQDKTKHPIEGAAVTISKYEPHVKSFSSLSTVLTITQQSDEQGYVNVMLPIGRYIAEVSAPGYTKLSYNFTIDELHSSYPIVELIKENTMTSAIAYYRGTYGLLYSFFNTTISSLFSSGIFVNGSVILVQLLIITSLLLLISLRTHSGIASTILMLPFWFLKELYIVLGYYRRHHVLIIQDAYSYRGLAGCQITIKRNEQIVKKTQTGIWGEVILSEVELSSTHTELIIVKKGYKTNNTCLDEASLTQDTIHIPLYETYRSPNNIGVFIGWVIDQAAMAFYDLCIATMIIFSVLFVKHKGFWESLPFLVFTSILALLWIIYVYNVWLSIKKYLNHD